MKAQTNYFLIGAFVIGGIVLAVATIAFLGAGALSSKGLIVEMYLRESVQGLERGAHIRFRGVKIGEVTEIGLASSFYPTDASVVVVRGQLRPITQEITTDELREIVERRIEAGLHVRLAAQGLTGALYLESEIIEGSDDRPEEVETDWIPQQLRIPSAPSTIKQISASVETVLEKLERTDVDGLVADAQELLRALTAAVGEADVGNLSMRASATLDATEQMVGSVRTEFSTLLSQAHEDLSGLVSRLNGILTRGSNVVSTIDTSLTPERTEQIVSDLLAAAAALRPAGETAEAALAEARDGVSELRRELRAKSRSVDEVLGGLRQAVRHLASLADTLERYPSLLILGEAPARRVDK